MQGYTATGKNGEAIFYRDPKRWWWSLSALYPLQPFLGVWLHWLSGWEGWLLLSIVLSYGLGPVLDWLLGEDNHNPPEEVVMQLDRDRYYRYLTYAAVPLHYVSLLGVAWYATSQDLSLSGFASLAVVAGLTGGLAINTGHELGHKNSRLEKTLAKILLALPAYGHFTIDHNRGHHMNVSTPGDPASSRMGESIYRFALREIPGAFAEAWAIEKDRLIARGKPAWHPANQILQSYALSLGLVGGLVYALGWAMLPFMAIHTVFAYWQLTSANYVEHYGLLRDLDEDGRYERCQPHHSWNSNHIFSNFVLFHLERHSDHHTYPLRRYQSLRHYDDLPSLPSGYFGAYLLAYVPSLWFKVMDRRLLALPHVRADLARVNIDPRARAELVRRYGTMASL
ncbi:MAG TPA: alkane 1-monooxygenase [Woeseiaceae bacterium]|jgi:alkane 1-monooxygenase|nr:alkane 1-monooxygenase [Woeseiaceae bacterium]